jgi:serine/threonine protein kinase
MSTSRLDVMSICATALELPDPAARAAYLDAACGGDAAIRAEIEGLLAPLERAGWSLNGGPTPEPATGAFDVAEPASPAGPKDGTTTTFERMPDTPTSDLTGSYDGRGVSPGVTIVGKYKLVEEIGEGGMGTVFLAMQTEPVKRLVAVKVIKSGMDSKAVLARFEAERQALAMMDHPNIARVLDAGATEDVRPFFVMELVKGVPITKFCDDRRLTTHQRLDLFVPVCQAIQHAHQKGVIHRDIKPSNVLVAMYDDRPVPKVIDFGVAKATGSQLTDHTLVTGFGAVVGTPEYMSPEQASLNQMDVDTRSDVYALGILLYELLTGSPPFSRKELEQSGLLEIFRVIREKEPPRPSVKLSTSEGLPSLAANRGTEPRRLKALVKGELDWIVMKALEKDRGRRYETANGFAADVMRYLAGEAVHAVPPSGWYRLRKTLRRNRGPVAAAAIVLLVLIGGVIGTTIGMLRADAAKGQMQNERDDKEAALKEAEGQRKKAEYQAASIGIDRDMEGNPEPKVELLRLARRLPTVPEHSAELRNFVIRRMILLASVIQRPATFIQSSSDGLSVMSSEFGVNVLRHSISGQQLTVLPAVAEFTMNRRYIIAAQSNGLVGQLHGKIGVWDRDGRLMTTIPKSTEGPVSASVSPDGQRLVYTEGGFWNPTRTRFWDFPSGKLVAEVPELTGRPIEHFFSPEGAIYLKVVGSLPGENEYKILEVWSAQTGQKVREIGRFRTYLWVSFSPNGKYVAGLELNDGAKLHCWKVATWEKAWPSVTLNFASPPICWCGEDSPTVCTNNSMDLAGGSVNETYVHGYGSIPAPIHKAHGYTGLALDGTLYNLRTGRKLLLPDDKRFPDEIIHLAALGRYFVGTRGTYDVTVDKPLAPGRESASPSDRWLLTYNPPGEEAGRYFPIMLDPPYSIEPVVAWAKLVARGELDVNGGFRGWNEEEWESHRQRFDRVFFRDDPDSVLGQVVLDPWYWLRQELRLSLANVPPPNIRVIRDEQRPAIDEALRLCDRLITKEQRWENYATRAWLRSWDSPAPALSDALEATRLAGILINPYYDAAETDMNWRIRTFDLSWRIGTEGARPDADYRIALRWVERLQTEGYRGLWQSKAILLYRVGRYFESVSALASEEMEPFPTQVTRAVLAGATFSTVQFPGLIALAHPDSNYPAVKQDRLPALRAMCQHKLGQRQQALDLLDRARSLLLETGNAETGNAETGSGVWRDIPIYLYREAHELITGKPPP